MDFGVKTDENRKGEEISTFFATVENVLFFNQFENIFLPIIL